MSGMRMRGLTLVELPANHAFTNLFRQAGTNGVRLTNPILRP
jgi:hypothetical protein